jgi:hypothetical protein
MFWNISKPILAEKSPRHMMMTRLLQYWFTEQRSFFIAILRHPLAQSRANYWSRNHDTTCGAAGVAHWLALQVSNNMHT